MNGIHYDGAWLSEGTYQMTTPSYRGHAHHSADSVVWSVEERDTWRPIAHGRAATHEDAVNAMTRAIAADM